MYSVIMCCFFYFSMIFFSFFFFFFNDPATTEIYTLSLHDALPIFGAFAAGLVLTRTERRVRIQERVRPVADLDRKSTRLNSSHSQISYAVFCLKKKKKKKKKNKPQTNIDHKHITTRSGTFHSTPCY